MGIEQLSTIWPQWSVVEQIGSGSYGKVYKVERNTHGFMDYAAVKVITIPKNEAGSDKTAVLFDNYDYSDSASHSYLESMVTDFVNEIKLMVSMKHTPCIVSVEDYEVVEKTEGIGWDIFIRMELLTSFVDYASSRNLTESDVIKLGQDLCSGLELCAAKNIIHRDIKPENIFVTQQGSFKLGDFGIAKEKSSDAMSMTAIGTFKYIAPEVVKREKYGQTVDIYSLGIVLYRLLNNNRLPFLNPNGQISYQDDRLAVDKRINGEQMPQPVGASPEMADVILRACQYEPAKRYQTATEFKRALEAVRVGTYVISQKRYMDGAVKAQQMAEFCSKCGVKRFTESNYCVSCGGLFGEKAIKAPFLSNKAQPLLLAIAIAVIAVLITFFVFVLPLLLDDAGPPQLQQPLSPTFQATPESPIEPTPKQTPAPEVESTPQPDITTITPEPETIEMPHQPVVDVEGEISVIREIWAEARYLIDNELVEAIGSTDIATFITCQRTRIVEVMMDVAGIPYSRIYLFHDGQLVFAFWFVEADEEHRFYFKDDELFRWRHTPVTGYSVNFDNRHDLVAYLDWGQRIFMDIDELGISAQMPPDSTQSPYDNFLGGWIGVFDSGNRNWGLELYVFKMRDSYQAEVWYFSDVETRTDLVAHYSADIYFNTYSNRFEVFYFHTHFKPNGWSDNVSLFGMIDGNTFSGYFSTRGTASLERVLR